MRLPSTCVLTLLACVACTVSPQPLPPPVTTPDAAVAIDIAGITLTPNGPDGVKLRGAKGTVRVTGRAPATGSLDVVSLSGSPTAVLLDVAEDGSFEGVLSTQLSDELRLQATVYETRSPSLDVTVQSTGDSNEVVSPTRPLADCLKLTPAVDVDVGGVNVGRARTTAVLVENACTKDVTIASAEARFADPTWQITTAFPASIPQGGSLDIGLVFTPVDETARREIVVLEVTTTDVSGKRPLTLRGKGTGDRCNGIDEAQCATMNSCRAAYTGTCDCSCGTFVSGGKTYEVGGGCASCAASCFAFSACVEP